MAGKSSAPRRPRTRPSAPAAAPSPTPETAPAAEASSSSSSSFIPPADIAPEDTTLQAYQTALAERTRARDALEMLEQQRARAMASVTVEIVSCRWAHLTWDNTTKTLPMVSWPARKCYQGKTVPDQECRRCQYVRIERWGNHLPEHALRYPGHGLVIPLADEQAASDLVDWLTERKLTQLRDVDMEIAALQQAIVARQRHMETERKIDLERRQGGRNIVAP